MATTKKEKTTTERSSTIVPTGNSEREKAIELALQQIERRFGKGAVMKLGEAAKVHVEVISTGSIALDLALGVGGVPRGRVTEIYGPEASGKTTLCQHIIANAQRSGGYAAFIDAEHAMDRTYAAHCGVDTENLLISQPDTGEQALEIVDSLVRSNAIDVVVIDSVAALVPRAEIEGEMGDSHVGLQARLMSQAMRKLTSAISSSNTAVVFTNQLREKVGVMFGNPETTSGKQGQDVMGNRTRVKVVKNKVAPPFRVAEFDIMYSEGISREGGLIDLGLEMGLVKKSGAWFTVGDIRLGQGRENAKEFLRQNSDVASAIEEQIRGNILSFKAAESEGNQEGEEEEALEEV